MAINFGNMPLEISGEPIGGNDSGSDEYRSMLSSWFNGADIAREDWLRDEQSAQNAFVRDMYMQDYANQFNASEAQKQRDFEERMSSTAYQRAVEDMKKAGINPIMLMGNGGADVPTGSSASASSASTGSRSRSKGGNDDNSSGVVSTVIKVAAGIIGAIATKKPSFVVKGFK